MSLRKIPSKRKEIGLGSRCPLEHVQWEGVVAAKDPQVYVTCKSWVLLPLEALLPAWQSMSNRRPVVGVKNAES